MLLPASLTIPSLEQGSRGSARVDFSCRDAFPPLGRADTPALGSERPRRHEVARKSAGGNRAFRAEDLMTGRLGRGCAQCAAAPVANQLLMAAAASA